MSSMRNAVQRRSHRERAQPQERKRLGLLEKHKDYKLRAQDHNKKKTQIKALRQKAADRNEDEFYFGMLSRSGPGSRLAQGKKWKGTVAGDRGNKAMDVDLVRMLKTQDIGYVRTMRSVTTKQAQKLREQVVFASQGMPEPADELDEFDDDGDDEFDFGASPSGAPPRPKKIVFVDEEGMPTPTIDEDSDEDDDDLEGSDGDLGGSGDVDGGAGDKADVEMQRKLKNLDRLRAELKTAETKLEALTTAERELEVQQAKMAKTATSGGTTRRGKKIMVRTRKR